MADAAESGAADSGPLKLELGAEEPEEGDEELNLEEEEDEDDDDEGSRKRGRDDLARFLDVEAEAGSEDEEEEAEMEEGFEGALAEAMEQRADGGGATQRLLNSIKEIERLPDAAALEERFGYYGAEDGEDVQVEAVPSHGLQPSLTDPKMWMVKCKPGKEREAAIHIMNRHFLKQELGQALQIYSVVIPEHTKGFVFVEGEKEPLVRNAIHGVGNLFTFQTTLVPLQQMTSVLRVTNPAAALQRGDWVRVKRGKYVNDLAQVNEVDASGQRVEVKIIPRLDNKHEEEEPVTEKGKKRKKKVAENRPKQRPFNVDEITANSGVVRDETGNGQRFFVYANERFGEDGYLYKWMATKSLITADVKPTLDELQTFHSKTLVSGAPNNEAQHQTAEERLVQLVSVANIRKADASFAKGDAVRVVEGGEKGLTGVVRAVTASGAGAGSVMVTVALNAAGATLVEQFQARQLVKHFQTGDHVKVLAGQYKDDTGYISNVVDDVLWVVNDSTLKTFQVLRHDVQMSVSVATGLLKLGNYSLHDLVRLTDSRTVGVIVKVDRDGFRVLDQTGAVHLIELANMGTKVHSRDPVSFDKHNMQVSEGDLLKVTEGAHRGKQGKVVHIYRFFAFLECREVLANGGIIAVKTDHCTLLGGQSNKRRANNPYATANALMMSPGHSVGAPQESQAKLLKQRKKDPLIGQTVTMIKGQYKAFRGVVRDISNDRLRVELQANRKTVNVERDEVLSSNLLPGQAPELKDASGLAGWGVNTGWQTPSSHVTSTPFRPETPRSAYGTQTPLHGSSGNEELWNALAATPARDDSGSGWVVDKDEAHDGPSPGSSVDSMGWTPTSDPLGPSPSPSGQHLDPYRQFTAPHSTGLAATPGSGSSYTPYHSSPFDAPGKTTPFLSAQSPYLGNTPGFGASPHPIGYSPRAPAAQTPGRFTGGGYDLVSPSPGRFGQATPAYPTTPAYQQAPVSGLPYTPSYTPGMGGNQTPYTPSYSGSTPGTYLVETTLPENWHLPMLVVELTRTQERGVIEHVGINTCTVRIGEDEQEVAKGELRVVPPEVGDKCVVLGGAHAGNIGELTAIDRTKDCLVSFGAVMAMIPLVLLGKQQ